MFFVRSTGKIKMQKRPLEKIVWQRLMHVMHGKAYQNNMKNQVK